jgi:hypothetical protein
MVPGSAAAGAFFELGHVSPRAFSLLLCTVGFREVRLFLRKSRVESGCLVYTRSENAVASGAALGMLISIADCRRTLAVTDNTDPTVWSNREVTRLTTMFKTMFKTRLKTGSP